MPSTQVPPLKQELKTSQEVKCYTCFKHPRPPRRSNVGRGRSPVGAVVGVDLAVYAAEAERAGAGVAVHTVGAVGPVLAGIALTLVDVLFASATPKPRRAGAGETVDAVVAQTTITAGV